MVKHPLTRRSSGGFYVRILVSCSAPTSMRLPRGTDAPPPATYTHLIGQALHPTRLLTGGCSCLSARRGHFRIEGGCSRWRGRGGVWEKVGAWGVRSRQPGGHRGSAAGLRSLARSSSCAFVREEGERERCLRGDILSACEPSSRGAINAPNFPADKGRGGRWVSVAVCRETGTGFPRPLGRVFPSRRRVYRAPLPHPLCGPGGRISGSGHSCIPVPRARGCLRVLPSRKVP